MHIGFIGFGEAARAFVDSLRDAGTCRFATYDILFDTEGMDGATANNARCRDVTALCCPADVAETCDWLFSAVTAGSSLEAAGAIAPHLDGRHVFIDINSVSPGRKRASHERIGAAAAAYLDMAVMAPVHPRGHRTPALLAGPAAATVAPTLSGLGFEVEVVGEEIGTATAIKMVRSLFVKGLEAVTVEMLMAARLTGCLDRVLASLEATYPGLGWDRFAGYQIERVSRHGTRRAAEMKECAVTLRELGLDGDIAAAIAGVQVRIGALGFRPGGEDTLADIDGLLEALAHARHTRR